MSARVPGPTWVLSIAVVPMLACGRLGFDEQFVPSNGAGPEHLVGVTAALELVGQTTIDTDSGQIVVDGTVIRAAGAGLIEGIRFEVLPGDLALFAVDSLDVAASAYVLAAGSRPLVLLADNDILIGGVIDVSAFCRDGSTAFNCPGPGGGRGADEAPADGCGPGTDGVSPGDTGGGGGGFGNTGANGGDGGASPGGRGGTRAACPGETLVPLIGGSGGGVGGQSQSNEGGGGGGAIQIASFSSISFTGGGINAAGAGGESSPSNGGCGGGSGGAILIESVVVILRNATLAANGGSGGEGGGGSNGVPGTFGAAPAKGSSSGGQAGGDGGALERAPTPGISASTDGGGGGGAAGMIRLDARTLDLGTAVVSPAPSIGR